MRKAKNVSKSDTDNKIIRLRDFEFINEFVRLKISALSDEKVDHLISDYIRHIFLADSIKPFSDFAKIYRKYDNLKTDYGYGKLKEYLENLQQSLKEKIAEVKKGLKNPVNNELISFNGTVRIAYNEKMQVFDTKYLPKDFDSQTWGRAEYPDIKMDCEIAKAQYFNIISYLLQELPKGRFKLCDKCEVPFFQATVREKIFCSSRCARTVAQANYRKKKASAGEDD